MKAKTTLCLTRKATNLVLLFMIFMGAKTLAQCPRNIELTSQSDVNNFAVNYPDCIPNLAGTLHIRGNVTDLSPLSGIQSIGGRLDIIDTQLTNLNGLDNLSSVGVVNIQHTPLTSLNGLGNLSSAQAFTIMNTQLTSLNGLGNLSSVGSFSIVGNASLTSFLGMSSLTTIDGILQIKANNALSSLIGLESITAIDGRLHIRENLLLEEMTGLENITSGIRELHVYNNPQLSQCSIASICSVIGTVPTYIFSNGPGCRRVQQVIDACNAEPCDNVTNLSANTVTYDSAFVTWVSNPNTQSWEVELSTGNVVEGTYTVTENSYQFNNLQPQTTYTVKVKTVCQDNQAEWVSYNFTTQACPSPYFEEFGGYNNGTLELCLGANYPLGTTDDEGLTGSWGVESIDTTTVGEFEYVFVENECGTGQFILTVTVTEQITPTFNFATNYTIGAIADVLGNSVEGYTGTWSPNVIDTSVEGVTTHTFTPNQDCIASVEVNVTVGCPQVSFHGYIFEYCQGEQGYLPMPEGVEGTWSSEEVNTSEPGTFIYTFVPTGCSYGYDVEVIVNNFHEIVFSEEQLPYTICQGENFELPATDTLGRAGLWGPSNVVDTSTPGVYTFVFTENDYYCGGVYLYEVEVISAETYYADADNDGYGDANNSIMACEQPEGYVMNADDCDDVNNTIYPGAEEIANDGIDQDCDGEDLVETTECNEPTGVVITRIAEGTAEFTSVDNTNAHYQGSANLHGRPLRDRPMYGMDNMMVGHTQAVVPVFEYDIWFRTICENGEFSEWVGPYYLPLFTANELTLTPNPTQGAVRVGNVMSKIKSVEVFDLNGMYLMSIKPNTSNVFNLSKLPTGKYNVKITDAEGNITLKKVIKK